MSWHVAVYVVAALAFLGAEAAAVLNGRPGDTASEHIRRLLGIIPPNPSASAWVKLARTAGIAAIVTFIIWFVLHIGWSWA